MKHTHAEILREYGPFPEVDGVNGVSFDGQRVWFASGDRLNALDPESGEIVGALDVSPRTVQRALEVLAEDDRVKSFGRGRACRWMVPNVPGFPTSLLLPAPPTSG